VRYERNIKGAFEHALEEFPGPMRESVWADKYKYLTDASLITARVQPGAAILDIGGARGPNCAMLSRLGRFDLHLVDRFDLSTDEINGQAGHPTRTFYQGQGVQVAACDVQSEPLPFADASFDLVTAVDLIEHFPGSAQNAFREIYRVLKPGGQLISGCPNIANLQNRLKLLFGNSIHSKIDGWYDSSVYRGHIREYSRREWKWMLDQVGFERVELRMGEEQLDSVIRDRAKLQRDRSAGSTRLELSKPGDLAFYLGALLYYGVVTLLPSLRYFIRVSAQRPSST
jgi:SAM-dependent methyltransferase